MSKARKPPSGRFTSTGAHPLRRVRCGLALTALSSFVSVGTLAETGVARASASEPEIPCGFYLSTPDTSGVVGGEAFSVSILPDTPAEACTTSFVVTATVLVATTLPDNVLYNPLKSTITVTFRPSQLPPVLVWAWSPHCSDPAIAPLQFVVSSPTGGTSRVPLTPESCTEIGSDVKSRITPPLTFSPNPNTVVGIASTPEDQGYRTIALGGNLSTYGNATLVGSPVGGPGYVGIANDPTSLGFWTVASKGGVFALGGAPFFGSMGAAPLNQPIVGMAATPSGDGYWLVASDGGVFSFGDAGFFGSMGGTRLNEPIVGMASTPSGNGYWLVAADGGVFGFGDAVFSGSMGGQRLNAPISGMAASPDGGYWLVGTDGAIFSFGGAPFLGSMGGQPLSAPIAGMAASTDGQGYWLVGADNGVFSFGDAPYLGPPYYG